MTSIIIILTAIAAFLMLRSLLDAIRTMQYHQLQARRSCMTLAELREDLNRQYYSQNMKEAYERTKDL
jgi:hypothetical protein